MESNFAYSFEPKDYPDCTFKQLNKLPLDTYNRVQSAISRFNEVKTPNGDTPSEIIKEKAWGNIKRSAQVFGIDLEVEDWKDLEPHKYIKNLKDKSPFNFRIKRAASSVKNKMIIEGTATSELFDTFHTKCTHECLLDLADQINYRSLSYPIILEDTHAGRWKDNIGIVTSAKVVYGSNGHELVIQAELDPDHPLSSYLYKTIEQKMIEYESNSVDNKPNKFVKPDIGLSINGFVLDAHIINESDGVVQNITPEEFSYLRGTTEIIVDKIYLEKIGITNIPSNPISYVHRIVREAMKITRSVPSNPQNYKKDDTSSWSFSSSDGNKIIDKGGWSLYAQCHAYRDDSKDKETKEAYKLPHHKLNADGDITLYWSGVRAAMAALLGARGGTDIPMEEKQKVYNHLARHYREFDKEPPEFHRESNESNIQGDVLMEKEIKQEVAVEKEENTPTQETTSKTDVVKEEVKQEVKEEEVKEEVKEEIKQEAKKEVKVAEIVREEKVKTKKNEEETKEGAKILRESLEKLTKTVGNLDEVLNKNNESKPKNIDLSAYIKREDVEKLINEKVTGLINGTVQQEFDKRLSDINLMRESILVLNQTVEKMFNIINKKPEDQSNRIVREKILEDEAKKQEENKKPIEVASEYLYQMMLQKGNLQ